MTDENVLLRCDASYLNNRRIATLGVYDEFEDKRYGTILYNIENSADAELCAMIFAIKIAKTKKYKFIIIANDCRGVNTRNLYQVAQPYFHVIQFLWIRRSENLIADSIATKLRKNTHNLNLFKKNEYALMINTFSSFSTKHIIHATKYIASPRDSRVLVGYLTKTSCKIPKNNIIPNNFMLYKFVYHVLNQEDRLEFYLYLKKVYPRLQSKKRLFDRPTNSVMAQLISQILSTIKENLTKRT